MGLLGRLFRHRAAKETYLLMTGRGNVVMQFEHRVEPSEIDWKSLPKGLYRLQVVRGGRFGEILWTHKNDEGVEPDEAEELMARLRKLVGKKKIKPEDIMESMDRDIKRVEAWISLFERMKKVGKVGRGGLLDDDMLKRLKELKDQIGQVAEIFGYRRPEAVVQPQPAASPIQFSFGQVPVSGSVNANLLTAYFMFKEALDELDKRMEKWGLIPKEGGEEPSRQELERREELIKLPLKRRG